MLGSCYAGPMLHLTADGLRKIAHMLDALERIEAETGVVVVDGHYGHVLVTLPDAPEALRVVRHNLPGESDNPRDAGPIVYAIEIEVS